MTRAIHMNRWMATWAMLILSFVAPTESVMAGEPGLKNLRCVNVQVDVEQDPTVQSRVRLAEEDIQRTVFSTLQTALPLLSISQHCRNRFRVLLVLHDVPGRAAGYNGLLISGIERAATLVETGDQQEVEVWSGGIQAFRGPLEGASSNARQALARSLDHFAEAYRLSGNP